MTAHAHAAPHATTRNHTRSYPGTAEQARAVRADLRALLHDCPHADDIILCASELAANAATHSDSARPGGTFTVRAAIRPNCHVQVAVSDRGGPWPEHARHPAANPGRPHGLDLVSALADRWGIIDDSTRRIVWFIIGWNRPAVSVADLDGLPPAADRHGHPQPRTTILSGDRLRQARHQLGLSRETLAYSAGVGITTITRLEQNPHSPVRLRTLHRLAASLDQAPADLTTLA